MNKERHLSLDCLSLEIKEDKGSNVRSPLIYAFKALLVQLRVRPFAGAIALGALAACRT